MQVRIFAVPACGGGMAAEALNRFLRSHSVLNVDRQLIQDGSGSFWSFCVSYFDDAAPPMPSTRKRIDYREVLNVADFAVFAKLRALRKELSERDGVPAFALFTNEQLAEIVRRRVDSKAALGEIDGVGESRIEKYGDDFLEVLRAEFTITDGSPKPKGESNEA